MPSPPRRTTRSSGSDVTISLISCRIRLLSSDHQHALCGAAFIAVVPRRRRKWLPSHTTPARPGELPPLAGPFQRQADVGL